MKKILLLIVTFSLLLSCSVPKQGIEQYENQTDKKIFEGADQALKKSNYKQAIERYEALRTLYPDSEYVRQSLLNQIYADYQESNYDSVSVLTNQFIQLYPLDNQTDYAYYMKALSEMTRHINFFDRYLPLEVSTRDMSNIEASFQDFKLLLTRFPNSIYAPDARQRLIFLKTTLAQHELLIADYYYQRKAYVAAAERARTILLTYSDTHQIHNALIILKKSYEAMGLKEDAESARELLSLNYPNKKNKV